jgi:hypothetical protein
LQLRIHAIDLAALACEPRRIETMRHSDATAVVGQRDIFVALRLRSLGHGCNGSGAVRPIGTHMKITADVRSRYQRRQIARIGKREFAAVLAQFGRDVGESELLVDLFLGGTGQPPPARKQAVFVQLPAAANGDGAERDIVRL